MTMTSTLLDETLATTNESVCDTCISNGTNVISEVVPYTPLEATVIGVASGLLSLVTISGNFMVMISFKMDKQLQTISNYFLLSLAVADVTIGTISMPLYTVFLIQQDWTLGRTVCDMWLSVDYLASNASAMNLVVISFDRYFSVTRPLSYRARRTTRKAALMITSAWLFSAVVWLPGIIAWPYIEGERTVPENACYVQFIYTNEYMSIVTILVAFYAPVTIMILLYVRVWYETVKRQRELVHLQAGKKASSKRSDSSDETADDLTAANRATGGHREAASTWKLNRQTSSNRSRDSQEITYVPTSALKASHSGGGANQQSVPDGPQNNSEEQEKAGLTKNWRHVWVTFCRRCVTPASVNGSGVNAGECVDEASSDGYATPRSLETPVQLASKCPSLNQIRDPYASRLPTSLRISDEERRQRLKGLQQRQQERKQEYQQQQKQEKQEKEDKQQEKQEKQDNEQSSTSPNGNAIYTILIRLPPPSKSGSNSVKSPNSNSVANNKNTDNGGTNFRTSIQQMLSEPAEVYHHHHQRSGNQRSLPLVRRCESTGPSTSNLSLGGGKAVVMAAKTAPSSPVGERRGNLDDISKLPLDARLVPKQLIKSDSHSSHHHHGGLASAAHATIIAATHVKKTKSKKSSEKKQERKAAKTLSAILMAFIITWFPYSVLTILNSFLGKELAEFYIPEYLWQISYYLCYINSTVNPMLYALCNAAFRRTYIRILTCRWGGSRASRQPGNRYYYG